MGGFGLDDDDPEAALLDFPVVLASNGHPFSICGFLVNMVIWHCTAIAYISHLGTHPILPYLS